MKIKIIVSAFSIYPDFKSSEGIVNKNWIDIISKKKDTIYAVSLKRTLQVKGGKVKSVNNSLITYLYKYSKSSKKSLIGVLYRVCNKLYCSLFKNENLTLVNALWVKRQNKKLNQLLKKPLQCVFYARVLPIYSLQPLLEIYKEQPIPFIVNLNDPICSVQSENSISFEEKLFIETIDKAQCWTFPSKRLSDYFVSKYNIDKSRCFVIPHAMKEQKILFSETSRSKEKLKFIYTGTFYKSAFTKAFSNSLKEFNKLEIARDIEFTFILSQFDDASILWLKESIPEVRIVTNLPYKEVLKATSKVDCVLVVDSQAHCDLLKGKFVEAMSFGIPILAITYKNSVMDKVVLEYGCLSSYQDCKDDIFNKLILMRENLLNPLWIKNFCINRKNCYEKNF